MIMLKFSSIFLSKSGIWALIGVYPTFFPIGSFGYIYYLSIRLGLNFALLFTENFAEVSFLPLSYVDSSKKEFPIHTLCQSALN